MVLYYGSHEQVLKNITTYLHVVTLDRSVEGGDTMLVCLSKAWRVHTVSHMTEAGQRVIYLLVTERVEWWTLNENSILRTATGSWHVLRNLSNHAVCKIQVGIAWSPNTTGNVWHRSQQKKCTRKAKLILTFLSQLWFINKTLLTLTLAFKLKSNFY